MAKTRHRYKKFAKDPVWRALEKGIKALVKNGDLEEKTARTSERPPRSRRSSARSRRSSARSRRSSARSRRSPCHPLTLSPCQHLGGPGYSPSEGSPLLLR